MKKNTIKVLLVEDDEDDYILVKRIFAKLPQATYELFWEPIYDRALEKMQQANFDIFVVDYRLGKEDGLNLIQQAQKAGNKKPVILLTGLGDESLGIKALRTGADDYLIKSELTPAILERAIRYAIERREVLFKQQELLAEQKAHAGVEKERAFLASVLEQMPIGVTIVEAPSGKLLVHNPASELILGHPILSAKPEYPSGYGALHADGTPYKESDYPQFRARADGKVISGMEMIYVRGDGRKTMLSITASPIWNAEGKMIATVAAFFDISRQKELERQKDEFIGIASHELKTPVTSIKSYAQVLQRRFKKRGDEDSASHLGKMDAQLDKLTSLIGDLLDVTKMEAGRLQFHEEEFDFTALTKEIVEEMQRTTDKHSITITGKTDKAVFGDRERIGQVLTNLISNAIKYSPHSEKIHVSIAQKKDTITACVQDFGVGISEDKQTKVFERFFRVSGPKQETFPGMGLGLYISAEIIKRQGGKIWVESTEGKGSVFCFSLPIR